MNTRLLLFIFLGLISFGFERQFKSGCKETWKTTTISFLHNCGSIYLIFGSLLFGYYLIHLLTLIVVVVLWQIDKMCIFTSYYNNLCGISPTRPFHDIFFVINKNLKIPYFRYLLAIIVALYDIKKILKI